MNVEEKRLGTFRGWPANAAVDPARLAKAGFYYTGHVQEVQCFLCGTKVSDWNYGDQAIVRHRMNSPNCPFVLGPSSTCNVPLIPVAADNTTAESTRHRQSPQRSNSIETNSSIPQRPGPLKEQYSTYAQRLLSFKNWPITSIVHPEQLALTGFYYLQNGDMVECAFCKGIIMNWKAGDDPDSAHRLNFPNCDFYMRRDIEGDLLGLVKVIPKTSISMTELGIQRHKASQRPEYATYEKRLQTFKKWPKDLKQTPEMLAEAGFYYGGFEDQVRCFHCDGGLRNWQPTDDVWIEHARWFSSCGFVNLVRGREFVKYCINNRTPLNLAIMTGENNATEYAEFLSQSISQSSESNTVTSVADVVETSVASFPMVSQSSELNTEEGATETMETSLSTVLQPSVSITNAAIENLLETAPARAAIESLGLHIGSVKRALRKRMETVGKPYTDVAKLFQDVLEQHNQVLIEDNRLDNTSNSSTSELNNLFNQVTMQMTNNFANKNSTQESDAFKREKKKTENESDDLMSLREENRKLKEARLCKVCMDCELAIVFLPCGHLATCHNCAPALANCPLCRLKIRAYVHIFLS